MEFKMKTMKYILLIICVSFTIVLKAADFAMFASASVPKATFQSTSAMSLSGSSLSSAAKNMKVSDGFSNAENNTPRGPQRVNPNQPPEDPMDTPLGDTPWLLIALLALGYALRVGKKYGVLQTDNRK